MAPEIDGSVLFTRHCAIHKGDFTQVRIEKNTEYDLIGVGMCESCK